MRDSRKRSGIPINLGGAKTSHRVGEIDCVCFAQVVEREAALHCARVGLKNELTMHARDQAAVDRRSDETAGALNKDIVVGGFGHFATVPSG